MKTTHWMSRLLFLLIGMLPFQFALALPSGEPGNAGNLVITQDGSVKLKSELDPADTALQVIPFTSTDNGTLTVGHTAAGCPSGGGGAQEISGFNSSIGSYSPTGLTGGGTVITIIDNQPFLCNTYTAFSQFAISKSSNPGSSWLTSVTCNGVKNTGSSGSFSYSSGIAQWTWFGTTFALLGKIGSNVSCSIVHN